MLRSKPRLYDWSASCHQTHELELHPPPCAPCAFLRHSWAYLVLTRRVSGVSIFRCRAAKLKSKQHVDSDRLDAILSLLRDGGAEAATAQSSDLLDGRHLLNSRRRNHNSLQLNTLRQWFLDHTDDPYPTYEEKLALSSQLSMSVKQIEHWFTNYRKRHWKGHDATSGLEKTAVGTAMQACMEINGVGMEQLTLVLPE
jgi:hypothetical protein